MSKIGSSQGSRHVPSFERRNISNSKPTKKSPRKKKKEIVVEEDPIIEITLPPQDRPNFIRRGPGPISIKSSFDERWQNFLKLKRMNDGRIRIYQLIYFRKWKMRYSDAYISKIHEKTMQINESMMSTSSKNRATKKNMEILDTIELIRLARSKIDEISSRSYLQSSPRPKDTTVRTVVRRQKPPVTDFRSNNESDDFRENTEVSDGGSISSVPSIPAEPTPPVSAHVRESVSFCMHEDLGESMLAKSEELKKETEKILSEESSSEEMMFEIDVRSQRNYRRDPDPEYSYSSESRDQKPRASRISKPHSSSFISNHSYLSVSNRGASAYSSGRERTSLADSFTASPSLSFKSRPERRFGSDYQKLAFRIPSYEQFPAEVPEKDEDGSLSDDPMVEARQEPLDDESSGLEFNIVDSD